MNSATTSEITTTSSAATSKLGERIGRQLKGGEIIDIAGDLGAGKTTLIKGIARGLGVKGPVTSPSFVLSQNYPISGGKQLSHFDFYRLSRTDLVDEQYREAASRPDTVVVTEWLGRRKPAANIRLKLEAVGESQRRITIEGDPAFLKEFK